MRHLVLALMVLAAAAAGCGGGGGNSSAPTPPSGGGGSSPPPVGAPAPAEAEFFATRNAVSRFLSQATFGPRPDAVDALVGSSASAWLLRAFEQPKTYYLPFIQVPELSGASTVFWRNAVQAEDQLRHRLAYALSQIIVFSDFGGEILTDIPVAVGYCQDVLIDHAFGNYRELLEAITYTPAMASYLTYLGNQKENPVTGRKPDENYARELMQLFTIGVLELNADGTPRVDAGGNVIETYGNADVTGLAKVFTGLNFPPDESQEDEGDVEWALWMQPLVVTPDDHTSTEKQFLGLTIPAGTSAEDSVRQALDHLFAHPNVAPFISRQLIQRLVTSHPTPAYTARVAAAFEAGAFTLPDGTEVGDGRRGDLKATVAAILMDDEARQPQNNEAFGKLREPALRFLSWARAFGVTNAASEYVLPLHYSYDANELGQKPYAAFSVFNFYRPGYQAPGTLTGAAGLTVPELQLVNATTLAGYANFMTFFVIGAQASAESQAETRGAFEDFGVEFDVEFDAEVSRTAFLPDYSAELAVADDADALINLLDDKLTYGSMTGSTRDVLRTAIEAIPEEDAEARVHNAVLITLTAPDFLVQR